MAQQRTHPYQSSLRPSYILPRLTLPSSAHHHSKVDTIPLSSASSARSFSLAINTSSSSTGSDSLNSANITPCTSDEGSPFTGDIIVKKSNGSVGRPSLRHFPSIASFRSFRSSNSIGRNTGSVKAIPLESGLSSDSGSSETEVYSQPPYEHQAYTWSSRVSESRNQERASKVSKRSRLMGSLGSKNSFSLFKSGRTERMSIEEVKTRESTELQKNRATHERGQQSSLSIDLSTVPTLVAELRARPQRSTFQPAHQSRFLSATRKAGVMRSDQETETGNVFDRTPTPLEKPVSSGISRYNPLPTIAASPDLSEHNSPIISQLQVNLESTYPSNPSSEDNPSSPRSPQEFYTPMTTFTPVQSSSNTLPKVQKRLLNPSIPKSSSKSIFNKHSSHPLSLDRALHHLTISQQALNELSETSRGSENDIPDKASISSPIFETSIFSPRVHHAPALNPLEVDAELPISPLELPSVPCPGILNLLDPSRSMESDPSQEWPTPILPRNTACSPVVDSERPIDGLPPDSKAFNFNPPHFKVVADTKKDTCQRFAMMPLSDFYDQAEVKSPGLKQNRSSPIRAQPPTRIPGTNSLLLLSPTPTPPSLILSPKSLGQPYPPGYTPRPQPQPPCTSSFSTQAKSRGVSPCSTPSLRSSDTGGFTFGIGSGFEPSTDISVRVRRARSLTANSRTRGQNQSTALSPLASPPASSSGSRLGLVLGSPSVPNLAGLAKRSSVIGVSYDSAVGVGRTSSVRSVGRESRSNRVGPQGPLSPIAGLGFIALESTITRA